MRRSGAQVELSPARARVLEFVQAAAAPVDTAQVAGAFGQHVNTVREHLDALAAAGLLTRTTCPGPGRGRPSGRYLPVPARAEPDPRVREYAALAALLARQLAATSARPADDARTAGREWGARMAVGRAGAGPRRRPRPALVVLLDALDFSPQADRRSERIRLRTCPLLDAAREVPNVVCAVHQGMLEGALAELGAPDIAVRLLPFAEPDACLLELTSPGR